MATKTFKIGLSNADKAAMAQDVYERLLALTFPEYETTESYEVGDFVVYNDQLYKCIGATSGAWDSTKWQLATLNDLVTDIENAVAFVNDKANVNGNYPTMTVGFADNLTPYDESAGDDQDEPFSFQATGTGNGTQPDFSTGSGALMKEKQGNTVVVNQRLPYTPISTGEGGSNVFKWADKVVVGHKYLIYTQLDVAQSIQVWESEGKTDGWTVSQNNRSVTYFSSTTPAYQIITVTTYTNLMLRSANNTTVANKTWQPFMVDLTQWFNGDIPQDLLDNPSNFFRYYQGSLAYNEGTLVNANGRYIKCISRQQWDGEVANGFYDTTTGEFISNNSYRCSKNKIRVNPNSDVYIYADDAVIVQQYDANGNMIKGWASTANGNYTSIGDNHFKVQPNCSFITWWKSTTNNIQVTVSIYYEGETGYRQHYPYEVLTNNDTGNEVLRSAGSVKDYKTPDGVVHRLVGIVDLGSLSWSYISGDNARFVAQVSGIKEVTESNVVANLLCAKYEKDTFSNVFYHSKDKIIGLASNSDSIGIYDSAYTDAITFKTAMSGVYLFYELAEPTTEQGTPYSENLVIDDFGSMDFGSDVPQGALIFYPVDYKAFVDTLYKYTDGTPSNIALKSDLASDKSELQGVDSQLLNAIGGTLRQCLVAIASAVFDNTEALDLGEQTWNKITDTHGDFFFATITGQISNKQPINTKYGTFINLWANNNDKAFYVYNYNATQIGLMIRDTSYTDATTFKNAMKGVLLAYEKASE